MAKKIKITEKRLLNANACLGGRIVFANSTNGEKKIVIRSKKQAIKLARKTPTYCLVWLLGLGGYDHLDVYEMDRRQKGKGIWKHAREINKALKVA